MGSGARIADGLEIIGSEPDHEFCFMCVPTRVVGDESVVGNVGAVGGRIIAVGSCQSRARDQVSLSDLKRQQRGDWSESLLTPSSMRIEC